MAPMSPTRISIDLRFLGSSGMGSATYHLALWEGLHQVAAPDLEWLCHGPRPGSRNGAEDPGWRYFPGPSLSANLWNLVQLPWRLRRLGPALHHATLNFQAPLHAPCPMVVTLLDLIPVRHAGFVTRRYARLFRTLIGPVLKRAQRVIVLSEVGRQEAIDHLPAIEPRLRVVPCGLPGSAFQQPCDAVMRDTRKRHGVPDDYLLFVGPPEPRKNLAVLLEALLALEERGRAVPPLVLVGRTHLKDPRLEALRGRTRHLTIDCDRVSDADLVALRAGARGLLFPTLAEGFGYPPLEALAAGVPVAVSDLPVLREVLGDAALFLDPRSPDAWADAMETLASSGTDATRLREAGPRRAARYPVERLGHETLAVYREVLEDSST